MWDVWFHSQIVYSNIEHLSNIDCQILMRYIDFCDDRGFKKFSRNLDGSLSNETSWAQKLETLMILVSNYDILLWVEQIWFNILFPKDQGSWSIAVTVPVFKISTYYKTFYYKNYQKGKACLLVFLISNIRLINILSNLLNFYFK